MKRHNIIEDYRADDNLRSKFYDFVAAVFPSADFKIWHDKGCWDGPYIPISIVENDKIVANVSITKMNILLNEKKVDAIQFGTVGTIPEYRNRGLSRYLMEYALNKYKNEIELYFLFANETVLDFYPKFGFERHRMDIFRSDTVPTKKADPPRKLILNNSEDFNLLKSMLEKRTPITGLFGAADYAFVAMWHVLNLYPEKLYYFEKENAIVIASERNDKLHVFDIISSEPVDYEPLIAGVIADDDLKSIYYYFSPDRIGFHYDSVEPDEDSPLFTLGDFPLGSKPYHFPATAQT